MRNNIILVDIGNTAIDILSLQERETKFKVLCSHKEELSNVLSPLLKSRPNIYISSVNSKGLKDVTDVLNQEKCPYQVLTGNVMREFAKEFHYDVPNTDYLGADLFCDIIAYDAPEGLIVLDLGTASKILFLDQRKKFYGCLIAPGIHQCVKTLNVSTDLLKEDTLVSRPPLVSLLTEECISSGAINGTTAMIVTMVKKIKEAYSCPNAKIILTGGNSIYVKPLLKDFGLDDFQDDSQLVCKGLARCFHIDLA